MDASRFAAPERGGDSKLKKHLEAIRSHQVTIAEIILYLSEDPPDAEAARELLETLSMEDQIAIWSVSTRDGGIWETWQRDALKYGRLDATDSWKAWCNRKGIPYVNAGVTVVELRAGRIIYMSDTFKDTSFTSK